MSFGNPTYLWTLLGLIVPIAIHLWSKKEGKTIKVGSIQFLKESDSSQSSSIKLNEYLLLVLRLLVLTTLSLILAEPQINMDTKNDKLTYIIEPSLLLNDDLNTLIDSLESNAPIRLLQKGFPELDDFNSENSNAAVPNYWQLARDMEALPTDSIVVYSEALLSGFKGMRPATKGNIEWMVLDSESNANLPLDLTRKKDSLHVLSAISTSNYLKFETSKISQQHQQVSIDEQKLEATLNINNTDVTLPIRKDTPLNIIIVFSEKTKSELQYLEAAFKAISKYLDREMAISKTQNYRANDSIKTDLIVRLDTSDTDDLKNRQLLYKPDLYSNNIIEKSTHPNIDFITKPITSETLVRYYLPEKLLDLFDVREDLTKRIQNLDRRVLARAELVPNLSHNTKKSIKNRKYDMAKWLWFIFIGMLMAERSLAKFRRQ